MRVFIHFWNRWFIWGGAFFLAVWGASAADIPASPLAVAGDAAAPPDAIQCLTPLSPGQVKLAGEFGRRLDGFIEGNVLKVDVEKDFLQHFRTHTEDGNYYGLGKFIDGVVRLAAWSGDARLLALKKKIVGELISTQEPDGYIGWAKPALRIKALWDAHEDSYIIWALVSDYRLFDETTSLAAARRLADNMVRRMLADPNLKPDTIHGLVTFPASTLGFDRALLALSEATGDPQYRVFCLNRLSLEHFNPPIGIGPATQDNHAYVYLAHCAAQLDLYRQTGETNLLRATRRALDFMLHGNGLLITGSCGEGECWHDSQSGLQNTAETCAGTYVVRLADLMLQLETNSLYGDIMERTIYNALFAAVSPDFRRVRYFTPFDGKRFYSPTLDTFCCPNNYRRFMGDLPGCLYYRTKDGLLVNLYNASTATVDIPGNARVKLDQVTDYPSTGNVLLKVNPSRDAEFTVQLRIPGWCPEATVKINGGAEKRIAGGCFLSLKQVWKSGDCVELKMPMPWRFIRGRQAQAGRAAVMRGPMLFTLNRARSGDLAAHPDFEPRQLMINPAEVGAPEPDDSLRPGGLACPIKAWPAGYFHFWPHELRVPVVLTEFPDPAGEAIYFIVPNPRSPLIVDDELGRP
jgi:hypothetical protein